MLSLTAISGYCKHEAQYPVLEPFRSVHESLYITPGADAVKNLTFAKFRPRLYDHAQKISQILL